MDIYKFKNTAGREAVADDFIFKLAQPKVEVPEDKDRKQRRFAGVGYTGDMIKGHYYWGNVIFDLDGMSVPEKMPILRDHYLEKIVGFSDKFAITGNGLELEGHLTKSTPFGQEVILLSDEGFPWQMSVRIHPSRIEEVTAGNVASVNGRTINGPVYIFRESKIVETSFTPTGWDSGTSATALSRVHTQEEDQVSKELEDKVKALETQLADLTASNTTLKTEKEDLAKQLEAFSKKVLDDKKAVIKEAFAKVGKEISDEGLTTFAKLPDELQASMLAAMQPATPPAAGEHQLPEGLFAHQATEGRSEPDGKALESKGLMACVDAAAAEFKAAHK